MARVKLRKALREFIKANPLCSEGDIVAVGEANDGSGITEFALGGSDTHSIAPSVDTTAEKVVLILGQWVANGKVSKASDTHSWIA
jgi:hypothetical protein